MTEYKDIKQIISEADYALYRLRADSFKSGQVTERLRLTRLLKDNLHFSEVDNGICWTVSGVSATIDEIISLFNESQ